MMDLFLMRARNALEQYRRVLPAGGMTMVFPATDEIYEAMKEHELNRGIEAREDSSVLHVGINSEQTSFEALYISRSEKNDVAMRIYNIIKFPPDKLDAMLECVNAANLRFRFLKFTVDEQNDSVDAAYDFTIAGEGLGESAYELLMRAAGIIDDCYPTFMDVLKG